MSTNDTINEPVQEDDSIVDENTTLFIFGNIKIKDVETGEILVNQRF